MQKAPVILPNFIILVLTPILAAIFVPLYAWHFGFTLFEWTVFTFFMFATGLAITGGYHRLWSHRSYEAKLPLRLFYAIFGACALQNSIIHWCSDHRRHHRHVDQNDSDPYSAGKGFWFSHIGWILRQHDSSEDDFSNVRDLTQDPVARWQDRYYLHLALATNLLVPLALGYYHGRLWGVFVLAGLLRLVLNHHFTFFINSLAHMWGSQTYSCDNTSRDNSLLALVTYGEGYHNYHHRFQADYRNGIRWWHFDPTKWFVKAASWIGLAYNLKSPPVHQIEKARLQVQLARALERVEKTQGAEDWIRRLEERYAQFIAALEEWTAFRQEWYKKQSAAFESEKVALKQRYRELKQNLENQRRQWQLLTAQLAAAT